jgi:hypothetical protein
VDESWRTRRSSSSTRAESRSFSAVSRSTCLVSSAISRQAPGGRTAGPAAGSADSCSAEGGPGTAGTTGNDHHSSPPVSNVPRRAPGGAMILRAMIALVARCLAATAR